MSFRGGISGLSLWTYCSRQLVSHAVSARENGGDHSTAVMYCRLAGVAVFFRQLTVCLGHFLESYQRFDVLATCNFAFGLAQGIFGMVFLSVFPSLMTSGLLTLASAAINFVVLWFLVRRIAGHGPRPRYDRQIFVQLWQFGRWSYLSSLATLLFSQMDRILITSFFGGAFLPLYTMGRRSYDLGHELLARQTAHLFPMLSAEADQKTEVIERIEPRVRWFISLVSVWFYSSVVLIGPALFDMLAGQNFGTRAAPYIVIFSIVGLVHAQAIVPWHFCFATDRVGLTCAFQLMCSLGILPAMYILGKLFGFTGAVCGQLFIALPVLWFNWKFWKSRRTQDKVSMFFEPMFTPLLLYGAALALWLNIYTTHTPAWVALLSGGMFALAYLPVAIRMENVFSPANTTSSTLMRAVEKLSAKFPIPEFALSLIFGKTAHSE